MTRLWQMFDELDPPQRIAVALGLPLLLLVAYWFLVVSPRMYRTNELRQQIDALLQERDAKEASTAGISDRKREVEELEGDLNRAMLRLPDQKEIPQLLSSISNLGRDSGLDILVFRLKPERLQDFYAEVPVEMVVRGNYHRIAGFLDAVGRLDRIVNVSDLWMKEPKLYAEDLVLQAGAQVTTFRFLSEAERQKVAEARKRGEDPNAKGAK